MYGVDTTRPGAQEYYDSLVALYAEWGVDYVKADDMSRPYHEGEITALSEAIRKSPRPMVLSLSPGATPIEKAEHVKAHANLWRISPDFWDLWRLLDRQFELCRQWSPHAGPGHWPDADMLPLGKLRISPDDYVAEQMGLTTKEITSEYSRFTGPEKVTLMTLWSIFRSPLMMGGHLPENDDLTLRLLTNAEVLAVNQASTRNREVLAEGKAVAWPRRRTAGPTWRSSTAARRWPPSRCLSRGWASRGRPGCAISGSAPRGEATRAVRADVEPHGAVLLKLTAQR